MSSKTARHNAIQAITTYKPEAAPLNFADTRPTDIFGCNVFNDRVMRERLPKSVYKALRKTIATGEAWYYSRSRKKLWKKGESSGHTQRVVEMRMDCDQDAVWIKVEQHGAACHTGRRSCFYRAVTGEGGETKLSFVDADKLFDPAKVYR